MSDSSTTTSTTSARTAWKSRLDAAVYSRAMGRLALLPLALAGQRRFERHGVTPRWAYVAMRKLYGGRDEALFTSLVEAAREGRAQSGPAGLTGVAAGEIDQAVDRLREDGIAVLSRRLDSSVCDDLERIGRTAPATLIGGAEGRPGRAVFDEGRPLAPRYDIDELDVLRSRACQLLLADESLLAIAWRYLGSTPIQDLVTMWWSTASAASAEAAQQFHFDLDRLRFLKVFVFLTDVDEETGPHVYVRGTHRQLEQRLRRDGRKSDEEVLRRHRDDVVAVSGPRGTTFLADTKGLHKGQNLRRGHRLVFQLEFATSLFGSPYSVPEIRDPVPEFADVVERYPTTFQRFRVLRTS